MDAGSVARFPDNVSKAIFARELSTGAPGTMVHRMRSMYKQVMPNRVAHAISAPECNWLGFSSDGQFLLGIRRATPGATDAHSSQSRGGGHPAAGTPDQAGDQLQELVVYRFRGSTACLRGDETSLDTLPPNIASNFGTFFVHVHTVKINLGTEQLHREFCVFLRNGQYALLATSQFCEREGEPLSGPDRPPSFNLCFVVVRLADGSICDRKPFNDDCMRLSKNAAVSVYRDRLSILSMKRQEVHIYTIEDTGVLREDLRVGAHCSAEEEEVLAAQAAREREWAAAHGGRAAARRSADQQARRSSDMGARRSADQGTRSAEGGAAAAAAAADGAAAVAVVAAAGAAHQLPHPHPHLDPRAWQRQRQVAMIQQQLFQQQQLQQQLLVQLMQQRRRRAAGAAGAGAEALGSGAQQQEGSAPAANGCANDSGCGRAGGADTPDGAAAGLPLLALGARGEAGSRKRKAGGLPGQRGRWRGFRGPEANGNGAGERGAEEDRGGSDASGSDDEEVRSYQTIPAAYQGGGGGNGRVRPGRLGGAGAYAAQVQAQAAPGCAACGRCWGACCACGGVPTPVACTLQGAGGAAHAAASLDTGAFWSAGVSGAGGAGGAGGGSGAVGSGSAAGEPGSGTAGASGAPQQQPLPAFLPPLAPSGDFGWPFSWYTRNLPAIASPAAAGAAAIAMATRTHAAAVARAMAQAEAERGSSSEEESGSDGDSERESDSESGPSSSGGEGSDGDRAAAGGAATAAAATPSGSAGAGGGRGGGGGAGAGGQSGQGTPVQLQRAQRIDSSGAGSGAGGGRHQPPMICGLRQRILAYLFKHSFAQLCRGGAAGAAAGEEDDRPRGSGEDSPQSSSHRSDGSAASDGGGDSDDGCAMVPVFRPQLQLHHHHEQQQRQAALEDPRVVPGTCEGEGDGEVPTFDCAPRRPPPQQQPAPPGAPAGPSSSSGGGGLAGGPAALQERLAALRRAREHGEALRMFHRHFASLEGAMILRASLLDEERLLLMLCPSNWRSRGGGDAAGAGASPAPAYAAFYNVRTTLVEAFLPVDSREFVQLLETQFSLLQPPATGRAWDQMGAAQPLVPPSAEGAGAGAGGAGDEHFSSAALQRNQHALRVARRLNSLCMRGPSSATDSPYLDPRLFMFDDRVLEAAERLRPRPDIAARFFVGRFGRTRFKLEPPPERETPSAAAAAAAAAAGAGGGPTGRVRVNWHLGYLFHPTMPFVLSVMQGSMQPQVVSVHYRMA